MPGEKILVSWVYSSPAASPKAGNESHHHPLEINLGPSKVGRSNPAPFTLSESSRERCRTARSAPTPQPQAVPVSHSGESTAFRPIAWSVQCVKSERPRSLSEPKPPK